MALLDSFLFFGGTAVVLIPIFIIWKAGNSYLIRKKRGSDYYRPGVWDLLKFSLLTLKWHSDKSEEKPPLLEHIYRSNSLKQIVAEGRTKLLQLFKYSLFVLDDLEAIKNVLHSKECSKRFSSETSLVLASGFNLGPIWGHGPIWKELRKYSMKTLGQLGFGKKDHLSLILADLLPEFMAEINQLRNKTGNTVPVDDLFLLPVVNVVFSIISGQKFLHNDERFVEMKDSVRYINDNGVWKVLLVKPNNSKIIDYICDLQEYRNRYGALVNYFKELVENRIKLNKTRPEDFVDHFLLEIEKYKNDPELKNAYNTDNMVAMLCDLFGAGMDSTSSSLEFALMYMVQYPEVQKRVQKEIDNVIGKYCLPSCSDHRPSMPYTYATLMEIHRMSNIVPLIPRHTEDNWNWKGKLIPKDTTMVCVMWAIRMNEEYWGDPSVFRPERFLNQDNSFITEKINSVMPFGAGGRMCPGNNVAMASSFTLFAGMLQKYSITKAIEGETLRPAKAVVAVSRPIPFHVSLHERV